MSGKSLKAPDIYLIITQVQMWKNRTLSQCFSRKLVDAVSGNAESFDGQTNFVEDFHRKWRHLVVAQKEELELTQIAESRRQCAQAISF